jgi:hypothetical protein
MTDIDVDGVRTPDRLRWVTAWLDELMPVTLTRRGTGKLERCCYVMNPAGE